MSKTIILHDSVSNQDYTLEYTREVIKKMELGGFSLNDLGSKPASSIPVLFAGAFLKHHPSLSRKVIDDIYENVSNKEEFIQALTEIYAEPLNGLINNEEGKVSWKVNG